MNAVSQMPDVEIKITGLEELNAKLEAMRQDFAAKAIVSAAYSANKVVVDTAIGNIEGAGLVDTGLLKKSITRKKLIYDKDGKVVILTGVNKNTRGTDSKGKPRVPWRYANVLEPKYNFMKSALEKSKQNVVDNFTKALASRIKKYTK